MDWRTETSLLHSARRRRYLLHNRERHDLNQNPIRIPNQIPNRPNLIHPTLNRLTLIQNLPIRTHFRKGFRWWYACCWSRNH